MAVPLILRHGNVPKVLELGHRVERASGRRADMISGLPDFTRSRFREPLPVFPARADLRTICGQVSAAR